MGTERWISFRPEPKQLQYAKDYAAKGFRSRQKDFTGDGNLLTVEESMVCECVVCDLYGVPYPDHDFDAPDYDLVVGNFKTDVKECRLTAPPRYDYLSYCRHSQMKNDSILLYFAMYDVIGNVVTLTGWAPKPVARHIGVFVEPGDHSPFRSGHLYTAPTQTWLIPVWRQFSIEIFWDFCHERRPEEIVF